MTDGAFYINDAADFRGLVRLTDLGQTVNFATSTNPPKDGLSYTSKVNLSTLNPPASNMSRHAFMGRSGKSTKWSGEFQYWSSNTDNAMAMIKQLEYWYTHGTPLYYADDMTIQDARIYAPSKTDDVSQYLRKTAANRAISSNPLSAATDSVYIGAPYPFYALYVDINAIVAGSVFDWGYYTSPATWTAMAKSAGHVESSVADLVNLRSGTAGIIHWPDSETDGWLPEDYDADAVNGLPDTTGHEYNWLRLDCSTGGATQLTCDEMYILRRCILTDFAYDMPVARTPWTVNYDLEVEDT